MHNKPSLRSTATSSASSPAVGISSVLGQKGWVLVTGASSGFGEEFAEQYAAQGHPMVLVARRKERLQQLAERLQGRHGVPVVVEAVDLSQIDQIEALAQRLRDRGVAVDILINNAGSGLQGSFLDTPLTEALGMIQLDIASLTAVTHVFAQEMRTRRRGQILLVASMLAYQGVERFAVYAAAKAYVLRLGEALNRELRAEGIQVTTVCPGLSDTGFTAVAKMEMNPLLERLLMKPTAVVRAAIQALQARRMSTVPGWANKALVAFTWATPRWLHQTMMSKAMNG